MIADTSKGEQLYRLYRTWPDGSLRDGWLLGTRAQCEKYIATDITKGERHFHAGLNWYTLTGRLLAFIQTHRPTPTDTIDL